MRRQPQGGCDCRRRAKWWGLEPERRKHGERTLGVCGCGVGEGEGKDGVGRACACIDQKSPEGYARQPRTDKQARNGCVECPQCLCALAWFALRVAARESRTRRDGEACKEFKQAFTQPLNETQAGTGGRRRCRAKKKEASVVVVGWCNARCFYVPSLCLGRMASRCN